MSEWPRVRLGDIGRVEKGRRPASALSNGSFNFVTTGAEFKALDTYDHEGEAVCVPLVSATGHGNAAINRIHYVSGKFSIASIMAGIFPNGQAVDFKFLRYYLFFFKDELLVPLMKGTSNVSLNVGKLAGVEVRLPPVDVQRRIVNQLDAATAIIAERQAASQEIARAQHALLSVAFRDLVADAPLFRMEDVAPLVRRSVEIEPEVSYTELGVRSFYKGTFHRRSMNGAEFTWQKLFWIREGDLIFSNLMAWEEGIAVAKKGDDGCVGNHRMLTCEARRDQTSPDFLHYYFQTKEGFDQVVQASPGSIARNKTLSSVLLKEILVPVPSLDAQLRFVDLQRKAREILAIQAEASDELEHLLPSLLDHAFNGGAVGTEIPAAVSP